MLEGFGRLGFRLLLCETIKSIYNRSNGGENRIIRTDEIRKVFEFHFLSILEAH